MDRTRTASRQRLTLRENSKDSAIDGSVISSVSTTTEEESHDSAKSNLAAQCKQQQQQHYPVAGKINNSLPLVSQRNYENSNLLATIPKSHSVIAPVSMDR